MQKRDISIIDVLELVETTKQNYKRLLKTLCKIKRMLWNITHIERHKYY